MEFIYSARKIVHSEEYIQVHLKIQKSKVPNKQKKGKNKPENNPTMIYSGNKQVSTIYERGLGFAWGTAVALLHRLGKQVLSL